MSEKQFAKRWERHFNLLEASLLSEHKCVIAFLISNVFFIWTMSYFGLHPVSPCDELSVTSSFLGQPVDKSRAGPFPNPKRETPTIQWISFRHSALEHDETHSWNCVDVCCFVFLWFHLWEPEFFFTRLMTSLVFPTSPSVKTNTLRRVYISQLVTWPNRQKHAVCVCVCLCVCYLSRLIRNAGLAVNMLEGLEDLCSPQISTHPFNFLQSFFHGLLAVLHTHTASHKCMHSS